MTFELNNIVRFMPGDSDDLNRLNQHPLIGTPIAGAEGQYLIHQVKAVSPPVLSVSVPPTADRNTLVDMPVSGNVKLSEWLNHVGWSSDAVLMRDAQQSGDCLMLGCKTPDITARQSSAMHSETRALIELLKAGSTNALDWFRLAEAGQTVAPRTDKGVIVEKSRKIIDHAYQSALSLYAEEGPLSREFLFALLKYLDQQPDAEIYWSKPQGSVPQRVDHFHTLVVMAEQFPDDQEIWFNLWQQSKAVDIKAVEVKGHLWTQEDLMHYVIQCPEHTAEQASPEWQAFCYSALAAGFLDSVDWDQDSRAEQFR